MKLVIEYTRHRFSSAHQAFAKLEYSSKENCIQDFHDTIVETRKKYMTARELRTTWSRNEPPPNTDAWNKWAESKPNDWLTLNFAGVSFPIGSFGYPDSTNIEMPAIYELEEWFNLKDE